MPICDTAPPFQQVEPGHLSRCWLTPDFQPPAVGAAAPPDVAEAASASLSVEVPESGILAGSDMNEPSAASELPATGIDPAATPAVPWSSAVADRDKPATADGTSTLVEVRDLVKHFEIRGGLLGFRTIGAVRAVDGVSFDVRRGETLGLVGESGCGKTTLGKVILRLIPQTSGSVAVNGRSIFELSEKEMVPVRRDMQIVFQDPYASLNPRMTVGEIIGRGPVRPRPLEQAASARTSSASCWVGSA